MNKGKKFPVEPLTPQEIQRLLTACSNCPTGLRNRALIVILWRSGLRISEALDLEPRDIHDDVIRVRNGKGRKARVVAIDPASAAVLLLWLRERERLNLSGKIFCTLQSKPVSSDYTRHLFPRLAKKAGIAKRVHPHGLRHTFVSELVEEGVDIRLVQQSLGHTSLLTTQTYIEQIRPERLIAALKARSCNLGDL